VRKVAPGIAVLAVILADGSPGALGEIRPPALPVPGAKARLFEPPAFGGGGRIERGHARYVSARRAPPSLAAAVRPHRRSKFDGRRRPIAGADSERTLRAFVVAVDRDIHRIADLVGHVIVGILPDDDRHAVRLRRIGADALERQVARFGPRLAIRARHLDPDNPALVLPAEAVQFLPPPIARNLAGAHRVLPARRPRRIPRLFMRASHCHSVTLSPISQKRSYR